MNPRMRRISSDWEQIQKDFSGHKNILIEPIGGEPPEKYRVTYYLKGIYLLEDGRIQPLGKHIVEIILHAEYPRYKPLCKILTPIYHPNFRDGQICIGDIWGAGESISDIIVNIGDMIQYKSWNSFSPLSADAANWAIEHKELFPIGNIDLYKPESEAYDRDAEIEVLSENDEIENFKDTSEDSEPSEEANAYDGGEAVIAEAIEANQDDFIITKEELAGVNFIPTAQRTQTIHARENNTDKQINFNTVFKKGIIYGLIGGAIGWLVNEVFYGTTDSYAILDNMGYTIGDLIDLPENVGLNIISKAVRISSGLFSGIIAAFIGALMGIGEGIYYGSKDKLIKYGLMGAGIGAVIGYFSGYIGQIFYSLLLEDADSIIAYSIVRAIGWAIMGVGTGFSIGLIKPEKKRILYCSIGGLGGGFVGGLLFDSIYDAFSSEGDTGTLSRAIGIIILASLIGLGIGVLEQFAKQAWLKVARGEFEGKEYLVFSGLTSIGNSGQNSIALFKDKLVSPNHCDILQEGSKYILVDKGSSMGTIVNGMRINRHVLRQGDTISIGNSVLVFNTK
ncbi:FHA domain-containing protein [Tissierella creatinini]|nr:FHA domain-containing protein [Tissierella creatinini]TJX61016.1 FHA domain-containing protein [Soehngenia saccharolytica]